MDEKRLEEYVTAVEQTAMKCGARSYDEGLDQAIALLSRLQDFMESIRTKDALRSALASAEAPTKVEERMILFFIRHSPQFVRIVSGLAVSKFLAALPAFAPGRPEKIRAEDGEELLDLISALQRKSVPLGAAKRRAAQRFGCSLRTVERLWKGRKDPREETATPEEIADWVSREMIP